MKKKRYLGHHGPEEPQPEPSNGHTQIANKYADMMPDMGASTFAVYFQLARHADRHGQCFPGIKLLARLTRLSKRTIIECIKKLVKLKLVQVEQSIGKYGRRNNYIVTHRK